MLSAEDRERLAADVLPIALRYAEFMAKGSDSLAEKTRDAAVDGLMKALDLYDPARGSFRPLAYALVRSRVRRAIGRRAVQDDSRPCVSSFGEWAEDGWEPEAPDRPTAGEVPMTPELRDMPADLRDTVRFYYVDGFNMEDTALLMGCCKITVRNRLREAAVALAPERAKIPARRRGEKRVGRHDPLRGR